jgi:ketol-acid reductoisomerase
MQLHSPDEPVRDSFSSKRMLPDEAKGGFRQALEEIRSGAFAREWAEEQKKGYPRFEKLRKTAAEHALNEAETLALEIMKRTGID